MPKRYPPPSRMEMAIRVREYNRNRQFPGIPHARQIGTEIEMMLSLNPAQRRERLRNSMKTVFRLRLRGRPDFGSLIFSC